jgi:CYTH domain-containing protein
MIGKYEKIERERRWLLEAVPEALELNGPAHISDLYLPETMIRVRRMVRSHRTEFKLTKKRPMAESGEFALTTIYLSEHEYELFDAMPGRRICKERYYFDHAGENCAVDMFPDGRKIVEVEFASGEALVSFNPPAFFGREVTNQPGFTGFELAS